MIFRRMTVAAVSVATLGAATAVVPAQAAPTEFYGNPQDLQACADIRHVGDWVEFACAWTFNDDSPGT
jgi:hypothetical protein